MDVGIYSYPHGDPLLIDKIVNEFLSQGKFDKLRKECMSDADTKPAYQNLVQRVENTVTQFLKKQVWKPDLNKNQLRDSLRKHILESKFFDAGINRIVDQVVNPNVLATVFLPEVEEVVYNYLSIPRPSDKNQRRGVSDEKHKPGKDYEYKASQEEKKFEKNGREEYRRNSHTLNEDHKGRNVDKKPDILNEGIKIESQNEKEKVKSEPEEETLTPVEKMEISSDESQESVSRIPVEALNINEMEGPPVPDSDDSAPLEINEKSMSESRDSEDSIMNQMSPISQGRLTPDIEEEVVEEKPVEKQEEKPPEEKKPLSFIGRIPKIKREDSVKTKDKLDVKNIYSSDESDSSKSYGKSDSDEKRRRNRSNEQKRDESDKTKEKKREDRRRSRSRDRHKDHKRERSGERHKKSSSSSSSSQRERSSSRHKSSHRHKDSKDSKSRQKEEEKKKSKSTDDHGKEKNKKEDRRSTDRDSNERERGRSSGSRTEGENRRREKEQQKTEEVKEESSQKEEAEVEKEGKPSEEVEEKPKTNSVLDFNELFRSGAITRLEFPKLTDDFYVKFNSTGFRYFEEWEKSKLDCEEEFKEFVDEAENDLSLLSDDESDFEFEKSFADENQKTIYNLLKGLGNFRRSLMFDPGTSEFYKWRNNKFYQKFRKKEEKPEKLDESIKENIDRGEKSRALHLKLLNKYKRKAMRMGKPRRRQRRPESRGIKEKNENQTEFFSEKEPKTFLGTNCNLVETENSAVPESVNSLDSLYKNEAVTLPESPENQEWTHAQKNSKNGNSDEKLTQNLPLNLPPSPDSDDVNTNNDIGHKISKKRVIKEAEDGVTPKKQTRRNHSQKYDSQDLYKPRPILNGSRTRGRERGLERDLISLGSSDSR